MKFYLLAFLLLSATIAASAQSFSWANQLSSESYDSPVDMAIDAQNNLYLTGTFADTIETPFLAPNGQQDVFVAKYSSGGSLQWISKVGSNGYDAVSSIALDAQANSYLAGSTNDTLIIQTDSIKTKNTADSELFLAKLDANGTPQWLRHIGTTSAGAIADIQTDPLGNSYVLGYFQDTLIFNTDSLVSAGQSDMFMAKYDTNGNLLWKTQAGGTKTDLPWALALDSENNLYLSGNFSGTTLFGSTLLEAADTYDNFIAKYDSNGSPIWAKQLHSTAFIGNQIVASANGNVYVGGNFDNATNFETENLTPVSGSDILIAQYTADGTLNWLKTFGDTNGYTTLNSLATDANNNLYANGWFASTLSFGVHTLQSAGNEDGFIAKISPEGSALWAINYGGSTYDQANTLAVGNNGFCYSAGAITDSLVIGNQTINTLGSLDVILMQIDQSLITATTLSSPTLTTFARPNPATNYLYISNNLNNCKFQLLDMCGKVVAQTDNNTIAVENLPRGIYLLQQISGSKLSNVQKIILQ